MEHFSSAHSLQAIETRMKTLTFQESWKVDSRSRQNHTTLSSYTDSGSHIVSSDHSRGDMSRTERRNGRSRSWFELVFENDESEESKIRFDGITVNNAASKSNRHAKRAEVRTYRLRR
jgi:hypothetical protein